MGALPLRRASLAGTLASLALAGTATAAPVAIDGLPVAGFKTACEGPAGWRVEWVWKGRVVARGTTFRPHAGFVGEPVACRATRGTRTATSVARKVIAPPSVGGLPLAGRTVSCNAGTGLPGRALPKGAAFEWRRGNRPILSVKTRRYRVREADVGRNLSCRFHIAGGQLLRSQGTQIWGPPKLRGTGRAGRAMRCEPTWPRSGVVGVRWRIADDTGTWWAQPDVHGRSYTVNPAEPGGRIGCDMSVDLGGAKKFKIRSGARELRPGWREPTLRGAWSALVFADAIPARARPGGGRAVGTLRGQSELLGGTKWVVVTDLRRHEGRIWAKVLLSSRPNGLAGWVRDDYLSFRFNPMRVLVDQSEKTLEIYRHGKLVTRMPAGVGKPSTPTPNGLFGIESHIPTPNHGAYGPMVLVLTGHSPVLYEFDGGDGRLAIHGTNVRSSLGRAESFGCVRLGNRNVLRAAKLIPDGTLLEVTA